jgi:hypothetical protein
MKKRTAGKRSPAINVFLVNTPELEGRRLMRKVEVQFPGTDLHNIYFYRKMAFVGGGPVEVVREVFVFISSHKEWLLLAGAYPAKKIVDLLAEIVMDWIKARSKKVTYRAFLYGPDGQPVKYVEVKDGKARKPAPGWRDYARHHAKFLRKWKT